MQVTIAMVEAAAEAMTDFENSHSALIKDFDKKRLYAAVQAALAAAPCAPDLTAHRDALNELVEAKRAWDAYPLETPPEILRKAQDRLERAWEVAEKLAGRRG